MKTLDAKSFKLLVISGANNLANAREEVDRLNVFPVPDGDTGTNMSRTFLSAAGQIAEKELSSLGEATSAAASATLKGARGNSGVILSQIMRGFAKATTSAKEADAMLLKEAFKNASATAYRAVMKPTEGTILTVIRRISEYLEENVTEDTTIQEVFEMAVSSGNKALSETTQMLPALKQAGVVDSGGQGLMYVIEGMLYAIKEGKAVILTETSLQPTQTVKKTEAKIKFGYCTEFIIKNANPKDEKKLRSEIEPMGDSLMLIADSDIMKVHIHTNNPGFILERAIRVGELLDIKIDNMREEHRETLGFEEKAPELSEYGIVSVASGEGITGMMKELGVTVIINGGQTMNPSTEDILSAIKEANAKTVYVLPNNKNIIMAAQQAAELSENNVCVIPTRSIPEGMAALMSFSPESLDNERAMTKSIKYIKTGLVTYAVRDSEIAEMKIHEGDYLGICGNDIKTAAASPKEALKNVCKNLADEDTAAITVFYGEGITEEDIQDISLYLSEEYSYADVSFYFGGQPVYNYIISVE